MRDYYVILGLSEQATQQQIKTAFRKLCMQYHPDKTGGNKVLEEKFRQILAAYEVLGDPAQKYNYDQRRAWLRANTAASVARSQPAQRQYAPPPHQHSTYTAHGGEPTASLPKKFMLACAAGLIGFFALLYFFGPLPKAPEEAAKEQIASPPITAGLFPRVDDPDPFLLLPGQPAQRLRAFFASGDTAHSFINMDADNVLELVAGNFLFVPEKDGRYRLIFHYAGALYAQANRLYLYFNDLVGEYRSCYRCTVSGLPNDESIAEIRMIYDSGRVIFPAEDKIRNIAILENLQYLFRKGIPPVDEHGRDNGTRKELLRHFIAYHFNQRSPGQTLSLFRKLYTAPDSALIQEDLAGMIATLEKRITSAAAPGQ